MTIWRSSGAARNFGSPKPRYSTSITLSITSLPMKSLSSSGPIGWFSPSLAPVSMSSALPVDSMSAKIASLMKGPSIRLTRKPGMSFDSMTVLPSSCGEGARRVVGGVIGLEAADDLDQAHDRDGREEMEADEPRRAVGRRGERR